MMIWNIISSIISFGCKSSCNSSSYDFCWTVAGILLGLGGGTCYWFWFWFTNREKSANIIGDGIPRGNSYWPLLGETLDFIACGYSSRPVTFMDSRKSKYGKVFKTHLLGTPIIVSTDPEVNKVVLQNHGPSFIPSYPKSITELLGKSSILQMNGSPHKRLHGLIASFLKSPQLKSRVTKDIEDSVKLLLASWNNDCTQLQQPFVYVQDEAKKVAFEVLVGVLMGIGPSKELDYLKKEYEEFIKGLICLPIKLPGFRLYKSLQAKERMMRMLRKIIKDKKAAVLVKEEKEGNTSQQPPSDVMEMLLLRELTAADSGNKESTVAALDVICENIIEMMIPGQDTVPTAITLAVKFLSDSPGALAQLLEENMELKKRKQDDDYSWTDYMSLEFTHNVINETLRMANIINGVWRKALKDVRVKGSLLPSPGYGHLIPQGWCVLASFISVHMDEELYENPHQFNPWRWQKCEQEGGVSNSSNNNNNSNFTPFGGGQRLCPGLELSKLELSIFLHHLVTTYRWLADEDQIITFPTVKMRRKMPIQVSLLL